MIMIFIRFCVPFVDVRKETAHGGEEYSFRPLERVVVWLEGTN